MIENSQELSSGCAQSRQIAKNIFFKQNKISKVVIFDRCFDFDSSMCETTKHYNFTKEYRT